jgi:hypothetical protein
MPECGDAKLFQVLAVRLGRTRSVISFSRKTASYFPRPRLRSQTAMSMMAPKLRVAAHHRAVWGECPGGSKMGGFQCHSVSRSKQCHVRCLRIQCQSVPGEMIVNCAEISVSDQRAGCAIRIGWDAGEAWRLIVTVSNSATAVAGTPLALWRPSVIDLLCLAAHRNWQSHPAALCQSR